MRALSFLYVLAPSPRGAGLHDQDVLFQVVWAWMIFFLSVCLGAGGLLLYLPPATYYLPAAYYLYFLLPTAHYPRPSTSTYAPLPTIYDLLPTTHCLPHTAITTTTLTTTAATAATYLPT